MSETNEVKIRISTEGKATSVDDLKAVEGGLDGVKSSAEKASASLVANTPAMEKYQMSAKATAAAMRGVPAQFTDIVTSLQAGQSPLTVFMQQGGQLKDMFGGAGNAAQALGTYVIGLVNPLTLAAAAAGALGYAYYQGSSESSAFQKTLALSGNAAGKTAGQLMDMSAAVASSTGATRGAVAEVMNEAVASGKISAEMLDKVTKAAVEMERAGGSSASATVKEFAALGDAPVTAVLKLNEKYHFLTAAVYDQIKALQDQGRETDAAKVAQTAFFDALAPRVPAMVENLGYIERAWKAIVDAVKGAGSAVAKVGRESGLEEQLAKAQRYAENLARSGDSNTPEGKKSNAAAQDAIAAIKEQISLTQRLNVETSTTNAVREIDLAKAKEHGELKLKYLTKEEQLAAAIKKINESSATDDEKAAWIKQAHTQYDEKPKKAKIDPLDGLLENYRRDAVAQSSGLASSTVKEIETLGELLSRGKIDAAEYNSLLDTVLSKDSVLSAEQKKVESDREKASRSQRLVENYEREFETTIKRIDAENDLIGVSEREIKIRDALYKVDDEASRERDKIIEQIKDQTEQTAALARVDDALASKRARIATATGDSYDETRTFDSGWKKAFASYTDAAGDAASTAEMLFSRSTDAMADSIAEFATTGKMDFASLATSIVADLIRIQAKAALAPITNSIGNWATSLFSSTASGTGAGTASVGSLWGAQVAHSGGIVGTSEGSGSRSVNPSLFHGAPRFHTGGIASDEVPTILQKGEGVFTAGQMKALGASSGASGSGGANVTVNVIDNAAGTQVTQSERSDGNGGKIIDVLIDTVKGAIAKDIGSGGMVASAMESQYGLNRAAGAWG